jgi:putative membrane protein
MGDMTQKENSGAEIIEIAENELIELAKELKISDKLAVERTVLAADRTMLAGVRTSLSFIGFGFTLFNVLHYIHEHGGKLMRPETPRNVGIFMLAAGTVPLFVMMIQYYRALKRMGRKEGRPWARSGIKNPFKVVV